MKIFGSICLAAASTISFSAAQADYAPPSVRCVEIGSPSVPQSMLITAPSDTIFHLNAVCNEEPAPGSIWAGTELLTSGPARILVWQWEDSSKSWKRIYPDVTGDTYHFSSQLSGWVFFRADTSQR